MVKHSSKMLIRVLGLACVDKSSLEFDEEGASSTHSSPFKREVQEFDLLSTVPHSVALTGIEMLRRRCPV